MNYIIFNRLLQYKPTSIEEFNTTFNNELKFSYRVGCKYVYIYLGYQFIYFTKLGDSHIESLDIESNNIRDILQTIDTRMKTFGVSDLLWN